jgi:hypothetical protein
MVLLHNEERFSLSGAAHEPLSEDCLAGYRAGERKTLFIMLHYLDHPRRWVIGPSCCPRATQIPARQGEHGILLFEAKAEHPAGFSLVRQSGGQDHLRAVDRVR